MLILGNGMEKGTDNKIVIKKKASVSWLTRTFPEAAI